VSARFWWEARSAAEKQALRELGFTDEQIREMPPEVAHTHLGRRAVPTPKKARPLARSRRARLNGEDPQLNLPEPPLIDYRAGAIAEEIRQLRAANPRRSLAWIAKQSGQPRSVVREILGGEEGAL
jgi:hypothetical protein